MDATDQELHKGNQDSQETPKYVQDFQESCWFVHNFKEKKNLESSRNMMSSQELHNLNQEIQESSKNVFRQPTIILKNFKKHNNLTRGTTQTHKKL